jgi:hypothetical protein
MTTYEHFQGQVRRRPTVTRHPRLQRHPTSPLGSGYAEEFELACRGYRGDPGRDCREVSSEIRRSHGPNRQRQRIQYSSAVDSPIAAYANHVRQQHRSPGINQLSRLARDADAG